MRQGAGPVDQWDELSAERAFEELMAPRGGRVDLLKVPAELQKRLTDYKKRAESYISNIRNEYPQLPPIYFGYVENLSMNAVAFRSRGVYCIGVHVGAWMILNLLFARMLAQRTTFMHMGNPAVELVEVPPLPHLGPSAECILHPDFVHIRPSDEIRERYSSLLLQKAFDLLVGHEIAHIAFGHVDFIRDHYGLDYLSEFEGSRRDPIDSLTRQTLEMDADCATTANAVGNIMLRFRSSDVNSEYKWLPHAHMIDALQDFSAAAWTLFRLYGDDRFTGIELEKSNYPPPRLRQHWSGMSAFQALWDNEGLETATAFRDAHFETAIDVERAFVLASGSKFSVDGLEDCFNEETKAHLGRIDWCWKHQLRDALLPFAYLPLSN